MIMEKNFYTFGRKIDSVVKFEEKVVKNQDWVNWGNDNDFPSRLYSYIDYNPTHNACINAKVRNTIGQGFVDGKKLANSLQTLNEFFMEFASEYITTGNVFIECVWSTDRSEGLSGIYVIPSANIRVQKKDSIDTEQDTYYYCQDWTSFRQHKIIEFSKLDPHNANNRQIYHIKNYAPGYNYYGSPDYMSVINDIRLAHEITLFHLSNIINGGMPGLWVNFNNSIPESDNEQRMMLQKIEERFSGAEGAGKVMVSFSDGAEQAPTITQIPTSTHDGYYTEVFDLVQRQILSGHKITSGLLIGLNNGGGLGSNADEIRQSFQVFLNTTIIPLQKEMTIQLEPIIKLLYPTEPINMNIIQNQIL